MSNRRQARLVMALAALAVLAGCEASSGGSSRAAAVPAGFECPASGTRATFRTGGSITYRGADPTDPAVCIVSTSSNPSLRRLLNFLVLPNEAERPVRNGLATLWPLEPGKTASYSRIQTFGSGSALMRDSWRVERTERATIAGVPRDVLVITRTIEGVSDNNRHVSRDTYRYDPGWRMFVSSSSELIRGSSPNPPFEVTEVRSP